jgi:prepilin-type N-terminal cleavage/methylation domain-containing protein
MSAMASWTRNRPSRTGFTLIELLVVITVMSILAAILLPAIYTALTSSKTQLTESLLSQVAVAIEQFHQERLVYPMGHDISARALPAALGDRLKNRENFVIDSNADGVADLLVDAWARPFVYVRRVPEKEAAAGTDPVPGANHLADGNDPQKIPPLHNPKTYDLFSAGRFAEKVIGLSSTTDAQLTTYQSKALETTDNRRYTFDGYMRGQDKNNYIGNW